MNFCNRTYTIASSEKEFLTTLVVSAFCIGNWTGFWQSHLGGLYPEDHFFGLHKMTSWVLHKLKMRSQYDRFRQSATFSRDGFDRIWAFTTLGMPWTPIEANLIALLIAIATFGNGRRRSWARVIFVQILALPAGKPHLSPKIRPNPRWRTRHCW